MTSWTHTFIRIKWILLFLVITWSEVYSVWFSYSHSLFLSLAFVLNINVYILYYFYFLFKVIFS